MHSFVNCLDDCYFTRRGVIFRILTVFDDMLPCRLYDEQELILFFRSFTNEAGLVCLQVYIEKQKGEILGVVIVESGWGSIVPTVIIASMMHAGPAEKSGRLNIGDQIMTINGTSLVGLPLSTCQSIIKVHCCSLCVI